MVPLKKIEYGFGYIIVRSPYTAYSIYLRGTVALYGVGIRVSAPKTYNQLNVVGTWRETSRQKRRLSISASEGTVPIRFFLTFQDVVQCKLAKQPKFRMQSPVM